jgi:hypothetical protein
LDQLAGPSPDLGVRRDAPGEMDAWLVVVGGEAVDNEVRDSGWSWSGEVTRGRVLR